MGKKQKKLTQEEIEEYKSETYQMMAAMSGKQVSELMGESSRPNYKENYCLIKQFYLKNCAEPISSKQLFETLKNQGYKAKYSTFRGLLSNYQKYGYVKKVNTKKPFLYVLTDIGRVHVNSPFIKVDENIQRYRNMLLQKMKELIEIEPEQFKSIYESIHGQPVINTVVAGTGSQYSGAIEDYRDKINDDGFMQSLNEDKIKELIELGDPELLTDFYINLNDYYKKHKSSMTLKTPEYQSSRPEGERRYYSLLVRCVDQSITRSVYENLPFRFIRVGNELRLKSIPEAGTYRNNKDATILDFDFVNKTYFNNQMIIKTQKNDQKRELEFYYVGGYKNFKITTMSFADYNKALKKSEKQTLKINVH